MNRRQFLATAAVAATTNARTVQRRTTDPVPAGVEPVPDGFDRAEWVMSGAGNRAHDARRLLWSAEDPALAADHLREALRILEEGFINDP